MLEETLEVLYECRFCMLCFLTAITVKECANYEPKLSAGVFIFKCASNKY